MQELKYLSISYSCKWQTGMLIEFYLTCSITFGCFFNCETESSTCCDNTSEPIPKSHLKFVSEWTWWLELPIHVQQYEEQPFRVAGLSMSLWMMKRACSPCSFLYCHPSAIFPLPHTGLEKRREKVANFTQCVCMITSAEGFSRGADRI